MCSARLFLNEDLEFRNCLISCNGIFLHSFFGKGTRGHFHDPRSPVPQILLKRGQTSQSFNRCSGFSWDDSYKNHVGHPQTERNALLRVLKFEKRLQLSSMRWSIFEKNREDIRGCMIPVEVTLYKCHNIRVFDVRKLLLAGFCAFDTNPNNGAGVVRNSYIAR